MHEKRSHKEVRAHKLHCPELPLGPWNSHRGSDATTVGVHLRSSFLWLFTLVVSPCQVQTRTSPTQAPKDAHRELPETIEEINNSRTRPPRRRRRAPARKKNTTRIRTLRVQSSRATGSRAPSLPAWSPADFTEDNVITGSTLLPEISPFSTRAVFTMSPNELRTAHCGQTPKPLTRACMQERLRQNLLIQPSPTYP